ncbi:hypothetical protein ACWA1C_01645 [Flectobacillus roseus]
MIYTIAGVISSNPVATKPKLVQLQTISLVRETQALRLYIIELHRLPCGPLLELSPATMRQQQTHSILFKKFYAVAGVFSSNHASATNPLNSIQKILPLLELSPATMRQQQMR